jgi:hypothetical protein
MRSFAPHGLDVRVNDSTLGAGRSKKESSRFLKKAAQKLLVNWACGAQTARAQSNKVFLLLFVHKK